MTFKRIAEICAVKICIFFFMLVLIVDTIIVAWEMWKNVSTFECSNILSYCTMNGGLYIILGGAILSFFICLIRESFKRLFPLKKAHF